MSEYEEFLELEKIKRKDNYINIYKELFDELVITFKPNIIYNSIYNISELKNEIYALLNHKNFLIKKLNNSHIKELLKNRSTRIFIFKNMDKLSLDIDYYFIVKELEKEDPTFIKNVLLNIKNKYPILFTTKNYYSLEELLHDDTQISLFEKNKKNLTSDEIIKYIDNLETADEVIIALKELIKLTTNFDISDFVFKYLNQDNFKKFVVENLNNVLYHSKRSIEIIEKLNLQEFERIISIKKITKTPLNNLNYLVSYRAEKTFYNLIDKYLNISVSKDLRYLGSGHTSDVYKVGDFVIKLSLNKHISECPKHFRIIKTIEAVKIGKLEIEVQKYLEPKKIVEDDIFSLLLDLDESGIEVTDPQILKLKRANVAFLNSLIDCDIDDYNNLPAHFIEKPLVIFDKDLIYFKSSKDKSYFYEEDEDGYITMDSVIKKYTKKNNF